MNLPRTIRITERKLGKEQAVGLCWHGKVPHIEIDPRQSSKSRLDTVIHEMVHCLWPELEEDAVTLVAQRLASVLWADRWRRVQK